ncbi:MAG: Holliday junction resolvase RecU [Streptococcaceae bacterium]|jgi:recombination protein U|nr:Holliday junction resolvase RecU [Streptococcaceae bacterium]
MVNYPGGIVKSDFVSADRTAPKRTRSESVNFAKRGMSFEAEINATNEYYLAHGIAVVHKKPTPVQIVHVDYPKRARAKITEAYFRQASTTDYSGVYNGHYLDFEAKETNQKQSFPLKNFHKHQIEHMKAVLAQQGFAFVLLNFATLAETYFLPASALIDFYDAHAGLKSMPLDLIRTQGARIPTQQIPRIPYIEILKTQIGGS